MGSINNHVMLNTRAVRNNTNAIASHSQQLQEHKARLNIQQRQIRENHEEMKRAAAQNAALAGLFQPYSVGKFNATAAMGGGAEINRLLLLVLVIVLTRKLQRKLVWLPATVIRPIM